MPGPVGIVGALIAHRMPAGIQGGMFLPGLSEVKLSLTPALRSQASGPELVNTHARAYTLLHTHIYTHGLPRWR